MSFLAESRNENELVEPRVSLHNVPITALRHKSRDKLSLLLNAEKVLVTEDGHFRDWRGIFSLSGLTQSEYSLISQSHDKTAKLLDLWQKRNEDNNSVVTLSQLQGCFGIIDRYDVCDDTLCLFAEDAKAFLSNAKTVEVVNRSSFEIVKADPDNKIITTQDLECSAKGLPLPKYDAFVIYSDKDVEFASELIERCEQNYGYSLCVKDRDLLGGLSFESESILNLLSERCNRLIIIVSKAFLSSKMQIFITNFAHAVGIDQDRRKVIPCLLEECELPQMLRYCFRLDYYRNNKLFDFWDKLDKSLKETSTVRNSSSRMNVTEVDAASTNLKLNIPVTPGTLYDKEQVYKFSQTPTPTPSEKAERTPKSFFGKKSSPEATRQIWPPPPKLRAASSMLSLNMPNGEPNPISNKLSQSSFYLNKDPSDDAGMEAVKSKRKKWYAKFLPPASVKMPREKVIEELPEIKEPKDKRPWYKIKKKKDKQKSKIPIAC